MLADDSALVQRLVEIAYIGIGSGQAGAAESIFRGVSALRPESEVPWIGMAVLRMNLGRDEEGIKLLKEEALVRNPGSDAASAFLGLALRRAGYGAESFAVLSKVADSREDGPARAMARELMKERGN